MHGRDGAAVVVVDLQPEGARPARHRLADAAHADDPEAFAADAMAEHPGRRPARPVLALGENRGALDQPPRHRQDQRHGHVGGVFGQDLRGVGDGDAARMRRDHVDIVDAVAEIGDQPQLAVGVLENLFRYFVGNGGHQHVGGPHRVGDLFRRHRPVVEIQLGVEQFAHPGLDRVRQLARDDNERFSLTRHFLLSRVCSSPSLWIVKGFAVEASLTRLFDTAAGRVVPVFGYGLQIVFLGSPIFSRWSGGKFQGSSWFRAFRPL